MDHIDQTAKPWLPSWREKSLPSSIWTRVHIQLFDGGNKQIADMELFLDLLFVLNITFYSFLPWETVGAKRGLVLLSDNTEIDVQLETLSSSN